MISITLKAVIVTLLAPFWFRCARSAGPIPWRQNVKPADSPEVKQLKERLQKLEQTMVELKDQLDTLEDAKKKTEPAIVQATYVVQGRLLNPRRSPRG